MPQAPSRLAAPLLAVCVLVLWSGRVWLLAPWEAAWPPLHRALTDLGLRWLLLGGLPLVWALTVDAPLSWRAVLFPSAARRPLWAGLACLVYLAVLLRQAPLEPTRASVSLLAAFSQGKLSLPMTAIAVIIQYAATAIIEELLCRGYLLSRFQQHMGFGRANALQSLVFAALHFPGWQSSWSHSPLIALGLTTTAFAYGLVAGVAVRWGGSIGWGIGLHTLSNLINAGLLPTFLAIALFP